MPRILVADDNADLSKTIGHVLAAAGNEVTVTDSGADALCLLSAKPPPELLILDIRMPGVDGHSVLKALGPTAPPVLVITGSDVDDADVATGKVKRVLTKPFDEPALLAAVANVLDAAKEP